MLYIWEVSSLASSCTQLFHAIIPTFGSWECKFFMNTVKAYNSFSTSCNSAIPTLSMFFYYLHTKAILNWTPEQAWDVCALSEMTASVEIPSLITVLPTWKMAKKCYVCKVINAYHFVTLQFCPPWWMKHCSFPDCSQGLGMSQIIIWYISIIPWVTGRWRRKVLTSCMTTCSISSCRVGFSPSVVCSTWKGVCVCVCVCVEGEGEVQFAYGWAGRWACEWRGRFKYRLHAG